MLEKDKFAKIYSYYRLMGLTDKKVNLDNFIYGFHHSKYYLNHNEMEYLKNKQKIKVCVNTEETLFKPMAKSGTIVGIASDYMSLIKKTFDIEYEIIPMDTHKKEVCDVTFLAELKSSQEKNLSYTQTFLQIPVVIATKTDVPFINNLKDMRRKKVGVAKILYNSELFKKFKSSIEFIPFDDEDEALEKVNNGELFSYIGLFASIDNKLQINYLGKLKISGGLESGLKFRFAFSKNNTTLLHIFEKGINNISNEETTAILNRWLSIRYIKSMDYVLVFQMLSVFFLILLIVVFFFKKLKNTHEKLEIAHAKLAQLAVTDKLTHLFNRHKLDEILAHETSRSNRDGLAYGIIMVDIDHFKNVNDTFGHNVGDAVLEALSAILMNNSRITDIVGRWGGEEFLVIVPATSKDSIIHFANLLREEVNTHTFDKAGHITISLGVTMYTINEDSKETIARADKALYHSKNNGRNQITYI